jgi:hypothetical protein
MFLYFGLAFGGGEQALELAEHEGQGLSRGTVRRERGWVAPTRGETIAHLAHTTSFADAQTVPTSLSLQGYSPIEVGRSKGIE